MKCQLTQFQKTLVWQRGRRAQACLRGLLSLRPIIVGRQTAQAPKGKAPAYPRSTLRVVSRVSRARAIDRQAIQIDFSLGFYSGDDEGAAWSTSSISDDASVSDDSGKNGKLRLTRFPLLPHPLALRQVHRIDFGTEGGFAVSFTTYGATLLSVRAVDKAGKIEEVGREERRIVGICSSPPSMVYVSTPMIRDGLCRNTSVATTDHPVPLIHGMLLP